MGIEAEPALFTLHLSPDVNKFPLSSLRLHLSPSMAESWFLEVNPGNPTIFQHFSVVLLLTMCSARFWPRHIHFVRHEKKNTCFLESELGHFFGCSFNVRALLVF